MSRRNQAKRRRNYGRRQHEVRERRSPDSPTDADNMARDGAWGEWTPSDMAQDQQTSDDGPYRSYAR